MIALHAPAAPRAVLAQPRLRYSRTSQMIEMRDGIRLATDSYRPEGVAGPLPILLLRTAYSIAGVESSIRGPLADDGYIFVFQNIRGRFRSQGSYVPQRQARDARRRKDPNAIDEATDAYDTIDWLVKNVPGNNGRVGMLGRSYDGWNAAMALTDPHPALKALQPVASAADPWLADQLTGAGPRRTYVLDITGTPTNRDESQFTFDSFDTYDRFLRLAGSGNAVSRPTRSEIAPWNDPGGRVDYRSFWIAPALPVANVAVATLVVAGIADENDPTGPLSIYEQLERSDVGHQNFLVIGPWNSEGWWSSDVKRAGDAAFESAASRYFRENIQAPFFNARLKGAGDASRPEALVFDVGSGQWRPFESWPPKLGIAPRIAYLASNGRLIFDRLPGDGAEFSPFVPDDPSKPRLRRPPQRIQPMLDPRNSTWYAWLTRDSRFLEGKSDVLSWISPPLGDDVTIAGEVIATLYASASAPEAEWTVELIDVYPPGAPATKSGEPFAFMVANDVFRARFDADPDDSFGSSRPVAGRYSLPTQSYRFSKGHRIMLQIESNWFPIVDTNPQEFLSILFGSKVARSSRETHRIYHSAQLPSSLAFPVLSSSLP